MKKLIINTFAIIFCIMMIIPNCCAINDNIMKGDIDKDGAITKIDAQIVLKMAAGIEPITSEAIEIADMDYDNMITITDAREILIIAEENERAIEEQNHMLNRVYELFSKLINAIIAIFKTAA